MQHRLFKGNFFFLISIKIYEKIVIISVDKSPNSLMILYIYVFFIILNTIHVY